MFYYEYYFKENFFSDKECDQILKHYENNIFSKDEGGAGFKKAQSFVSLLKDKDPYISYINDFVMYNNREYFGLDIDEAPSSVNINNYENDNNNYDWHIDSSSGGSLRDIKITVILNISENNNFSGGDFYIAPGRKRLVKEIRSKGSILMFPSYFSHKVTNVTNGKRTSLSAWYKGPKLK